MMLRRLMLAFLGLAACGRTAPRPAETAPRILEAPRPARAGTLRVLVSHDMEGLSGQDDYRTFMARYPDPFRRGQAMLAADVNAVVDGLFAGGATVVDVFDQHGSGQPDSIPDLPRALLDPRANQVFLSEAISADLAAKQDYDAVVVVGAHSKTGSGGFAAHSFTLGIEMQLNGMSVTETELIGYQWGQFGVPLVFAAGDDRLCGDLKESPWIECVAVKQSTSARTAMLRPAAGVQTELHDRAKRALERLQSARVMRVSTPVRVTLKALPPATLEGVTGFPGLETGPEEVTFTAPDLGPDTFGKLASIIQVASLLGRYQLLTERLGATAEGRRILEESETAYIERWLDVESGRWKLDAKR